MNGATGARFLHFQTSVLSTDEIINYNRIIKEVEKCDDRNKCVLMSFMMLHIAYEHTLFINKPSPFELKRTLGIDSCRSRND